MKAALASSMSEPLDIILVIDKQVNVGLGTL